MEQYTTSQTAVMQRPYIMDSSALQLRLDTDGLLAKIEMYLRGQIPTVKKNSKGEYIESREQICPPKANDEGIHSILSWISSTINAHTVQGNFPIDAQGRSEKYENYIYEYNVSFAQLIVINCYNWGIKDHEIDNIVDNIILTIIPFMSRLIDNLERKSYGETMRSIENNSMRSKGGLPLIN
jgi:hypothetical protein